jgi:small GTP-binding protein
MKYDYLFKIILVGDTSTGKTHFFNLLGDNNNNNNITATIGTDLTTIYKEIFGKIIRVNLWDTAGQERFHSIVQHYFRDITGYILFFNINNVESFKSLEKWIKNIHYENKCEHEHPILLIGNKNDLEHKVSQYDIIELTEKHNLIYIETSLKYNKINIQDIIELFLDKIYATFIVNNKKANNEEELILCRTIKTSKEINKKIYIDNQYKNNIIINNDNHKNNCC